MTTNDLVYQIAARVKVLSGQSLFDLRLAVAESATTTHAITQETKGKSRGELIEEIITEEFVEEFPKEIQEEE